MEWYIPITILPGIGVLILSTTNQMMALSDEIGKMVSQKCSTFQHEISEMKIVQLNRLTRAAALLYVSAACFVLSGIVGALIPMDFFEILPKYVLVLGVFLVLGALWLLIRYGTFAIKIRRIQHRENPKIN